MFEFFSNDRLRFPKRWSDQPATLALKMFHEKNIWPACRTYSTKTEIYWAALSFGLDTLSDDCLLELCLINHPSFHQSSFPITEYVEKKLARPLLVVNHCKTKPLNVHIPFQLNKIAGIASYLNQRVDQSSACLGKRWSRTSWIAIFLRVLHQHKTRIECCFLNVPQVDMYSGALALAGVQTQ